MTATVFNVQRFSTEDGPGIRTTVFFKGCPLRCAWCHNPEGMRSQPELMWYDVRCIGTQDCLEVCPQDALHLQPQGMRIDRVRCTVCEECALACPSAALEVIGRRWTPDELLVELLKDKVFYQTSGGGVTFSGGEPLNQVGFLVELLPRCKEAGLQVALDTCAAVPWERFERVLTWVDLVLLDLKVMDPQAHLEATGVANERILENACLLAHYGIRMWVRTPVVPGFTQDHGNIAAIGAFIRQNLPAVERWDLLAYTNLGRPKYHRLDMPYELEEIPLLTRADMQAVHQVALEVVPVAQWSGATRD